MNSKIFIAFAAVLVVLIGAFLLLGRSNSPQTEAPGPTVEQSTENVSSPPNTSTAPTENSAAKEVSVSLSSSGYSPKEITIDKGTKVVWTNNSGQAATVDSNPHPVHTSYPPLNLGSFNDGDTLELIFNETGTYHYHNHFNAALGGTVIVK